MRRILRTTGFGDTARIGIKRDARGIQCGIRFADHLDRRAEIIAKGAGGLGLRHKACTHLGDQCGGILQRINHLMRWRHMRDALRHGIRPKPEQRALRVKALGDRPHQHRDQHAVLHLFAKPAEFDLAGAEAGVIRLGQIAGDLVVGQARANSSGFK